MIKRKKQYIGGKFQLYNKEIINKFFNPYTLLEELYNYKLLCRIYIHSNVEKTKKEMKSALTYPVLILLFANGVVAFILVYLVPQFESIYK